MLELKARYRVTFDDDTRRWRVWDGRAPKGSGGPPLPADTRRMTSAAKATGA